MQSSGTGLHRARIRSQSGSVAMLGALWLMIAVICLATIDIGNVFWQKRELQKIADLAALAGASGDLNNGSCSENSKTNASQNGYGPTPKASAGRWAAIETSKETYEYKFLEGNNTYNACKVEVSKNVPYLFLIDAKSTGGRDVFAVAIAKQTKARVARVDIKSELLSLNSQKSSVLNALVNGVLGGNIDLSLVSWQGLADADISLLSYLDALALNAKIKSGNYQELLNTAINLGDILGVMANVASRNQFLGSAVKVLESLELRPNVNKLSIKLGDLLKLSSPASDAGINANVNVLDLVMATLQVAGKDKAISLDAPINLGILANAALSLKVSEPPQWGIGDPTKDKVYAKTSQLNLNLKASALLDFLKLNLDVSAANGSVEVSNFFCAAAGKSLILNTAVSIVTVDLSLSLNFLGVKIAEYHPPPIKLGDSKNTGLELKNVNMVQEKIREWIQVGEEKKIVGSLVIGVVSWLSNLLFLPPVSNFIEDLLSTITAPLTNLLDWIVNGLLKALGIGVGNAYVAGRLTCGYEADLVY